MATVARNNNKGSPGEKPVTMLSCSYIKRGVYYPSVRGGSGQANEEVISGVQWDKNPKSVCSLSKLDEFLRKPQAVCNPDTFRERLGTWTSKTRNPAKNAPRMIFAVK